MSLEVWTKSRALGLALLLGACRCAGDGSVTANVSVSAGMSGSGGASANSPLGGNTAHAGKSNANSAGAPSAGSSSTMAGGSGQGGSTTTAGAPTGGTAGNGQSTAGSAPLGGNAGAPPNGGQAGKATAGSATGGGSGAPPLGSVSYGTNFDLTELPISEKGVWKFTGLDWTSVETANGNAFGTQVGDGTFTDSYAYLAGFPANHRASGVIHRDANVDASCTHEVEILLRWSDAAHDAHGYECNLAFDGSYTEIVRWNGKLGSFDYLSHKGSVGAVHDGDTFGASVVGNSIVVTLNGVEINRATDSTFTTGNPGMAFWRGGKCGTKGDYGFTQFSASSIDP